MRRRTANAGKRKAAIGFALGCVGLGLAACSGPVRFVHPDADVAFYESVGIVPFTSLAQDRSSGYKVSDIFFTELIRARFAEVAEPGQFAAAMKLMRGGTPVDAPWASADLVRLGEEAGVQGVFLGTVRDYEMMRIGQGTYPHVAVEARLVDVASGRVVWSASDTRTGGPGVPLIGWLFSLFGKGETRTLSELTSSVCHDLLSTLPGANR